MVDLIAVARDPASREYDYLWLPRTLAACPCFLLTCLHTTTNDDASTRVTDCSNTRVYYYKFLVILLAEQLGFFFCETHPGRTSHG